MASKKPSFNCTVIQDASDPSNDSSIWYILSAVFIAILCLGSAILFFRKVSRPNIFQDLSANRYKIKIISVFYDFGTHILSLIVIIHSVIKAYSIPWQPIRITEETTDESDDPFDTNTDTTDSDYMVYINSNTVSCTANAFAWTDSVSIGGQLCYMNPIDVYAELSLSTGFTFPLNSGTQIALITLALLSGLITAVLKVKYSLYPDNKYQSFVTQCIIYSIPISAAYYTLIDTDYCYGFDPAYQSGLDGSPSILVMYGMAGTFVDYGLLISFCLWLIIKAIFNIKDCTSVTTTRWIFAFICLTALAGIIYRVITFLEGFDNFLNPTLLTNDAIFYFHTILTLLPALELIPVVTNLLGKRHARRIQDNNNEL